MNSFSSRWVHFACSSTIYSTHSPCLRNRRRIYPSFSFSMMHDIHCHTTTTLIHTLTANSFSTTCPPLPSCSNTLPLTATFADANSIIRATALDLAARSRPTIALMHSYGGVVGTQALVGLGWNERAKPEQPGGVVALVYMASYMLPVRRDTSTPLGTGARKCDRNHQQEP